MMRHCLLTIIQALPCHNSWRLLLRKFQLNKMAVINIFFFFLFRPTINFPVSLISTVVEFSVGAVSFFVHVFIAPEIGCFVALFSTVIARTLEELCIFVISFYIV